MDSAFVHGGDVNNFQPSEEKAWLIDEIQMFCCFKKHVSVKNDICKNNATPVFHFRVNQILQKKSEISLEALTLTLCSVHHTS